MAQNITWPDGTQFANVPAFDLPKTGGGTARFTDTSPTTATDADVASGKIYFKSDGSQSTGTGSGGSATLITKSITANGTYNASSDNADGYSSVTVNVSGGGGAVAPKEVNFIDYDGTILHAYTVAEFQQLSAMPSNPSHSGLTAQGWNWTLADAKAQLTAMPDAGLTIGQMYVTDDGKTRVYIHLEPGRTSACIGIAVNGSAVVDYGDGSQTTTLTGTSLTTVKTTPLHDWPVSGGDYTVTIDPTSGSTIAFLGTTYGSYFITKDGTSTSSSVNTNRVYANAVKRIEIGNNAQLGNYSFYNCFSLASITMPSTISALSQYTFGYCASLQSVTVPSGVTSFGNYVFGYCYGLLSVSLSKVTGIGTYTFYSCYALQSVTIPNCVTSIGTYVFYMCYAIEKIVLPPTVTSLGSYAIYTCNSLSLIHMPSGLTSIGSNAFRLNPSLISLIIPSDVQSIGAYTFNGCYGLGFLRFTRTTAPTASNSNAFTNTSTDCLMLVPYAGLASYLGASNYPAKTSYTYLGYATYASGATLPTKDSTNAYNVVWYATKDDAKAGTNAISAGNGSEIYCTYAAV